jgi:hypothetical protein
VSKTVKDVRAKTSIGRAIGLSLQVEDHFSVDIVTGEPHSVKGIESASLLLTILLPKH